MQTCHNLFYDQKTFFCALLVVNEIHLLDEKLRLGQFIFWIYGPCFKITFIHSNYASSKFPEKFITVKWAETTLLLKQFFIVKLYLSKTKTKSGAIKSYSVWDSNQHFKIN